MASTRSRLRLKTMNKDQGVVTATGLDCMQIKDEVVGLGTRNCYLCCCQLSEDLTSKGPANDRKIDNFINTLSEVCEMSIGAVLEAATRDETTSLNVILFCDDCQFNLQKVWDIKSQLEVLKQELSKTKTLISTTFLTKSLRKNTSPRFNADIVTEDCAGTVAGDLEMDRIESNDEANEQYEELVIELEPTAGMAEVDERDPDWDPLGNGVEAHKRERKQHLGLQKSVGPRARKARLRALLKRQDNSASARLVKKAIPSKSGAREQKNPDNGIATFKFRCPSCPRTLPTEERLRFHIRKIHEELATPYNCKKCENQFRRLAELRSHLRKVCQLPEPPSIPATEDDNGVAKKSPDPAITDNVTCVECGVVFKTQVTFSIHLNRQGGKCIRRQPRVLPLNSTFDKTQKKIHRYICGECGRKYRSPHHLGLHIRTAHTDGFAFLCEYCCKPFNSRKTLTSHHRRMHLEEFLSTREDAAGELEKIQGLTCSFCNAIFSSNQVKRAHEARHTSNYSYYCEVCASGWATLAELNSHVTSHTGDKKYKCEHCAHAFDRASKRARHMKAKHGLGDKVKSAKCPFCDKSFWENTHLKRHLVLLHPNPDKTEASGLGCDLCSYQCAIREYVVIHGKTQKHMRKVEALGLTDPNTGLKFPKSDTLIPIRRSFRKLTKGIGCDTTDAKNLMDTIT